MKTKALLQVIITATLCADINAQVYTEVLRTAATDGEMGESFGHAVCISGNFAIVGAYRDSEDETGNDSLYYAGSAYIFERDRYGNWHEIQKIVASDRSQSDHFGMFVSISGNYAIVGVPWEDHDTAGENALNSAGSAYIFERDGTGTWHEVQKIVAFDRALNDFFGGSVAISGNYAIIAALFEDEDISGNNTLNDAGSAYIFERDASGNWNHVQKIIASERHEDDNFGISTAISEKYAIVGAYYEDEDTLGANTMECAGSAYIFERTGAGKWNDIQKIVASDRAEYDLFGNSVGISGDFIIVGALSEEEDENGVNSLDHAGSAYIFEINSKGTWQEVQKIVSSDRAEWDLFGMDVDLSGDMAVVGAYNEDDDEVGSNRINNAGSAYLFRHNNMGTWSQIQKVVASNRKAAECFGVSVGISENYAIVGTNFNGTIPESIYLFESCEPSTATDPDNIIENGDFGSCTLAPWFTSINSLVGASATTSLVDGTCILSDLVISNDPYNWHIQLMQPFTAEQLAKLIPGFDYTLSFEAYSLTKDRPCNVYFGLNGDPWTDLVNQVTEISEVPKTYNFDFNFPSAYSSLVLSFGLGSDITSVFFDNIKLKRKVFDKDNDGIEDQYDNCADIANNDQADADQDGTGDACESNQTAIDNNTDKNSFLVFPNPAKDKLHIEVANGSVVQLMNILGTVIQTVSVTDDHFTMDIQQLPEGMYMIKIVKDHFVSLHKIIFQ